MNPYRHRLGLLALVLGATGVASAATTEKHVIALKTHDFELAETEVGDLQLGEARTVVTDSGKTVDIIRTAEGFDIFVDGEQLDMPHRADGAHEMHHEEVKVECISESEEDVVCDELHKEMHGADSGGHKVIRIHREHADGDDVDIEVEDVHKEVIVIRESDSD
ncbi:MAG: hypothetical protein HKN58_09250 [Xanthomonadales bacterium]|nr:hypothetical protein [Xanthomonadales bacterium]